LKRQNRNSLVFPSALASLAALAGAQANVDPGIDGHLRLLFLPEVLGRTGTYPDGVNGIASWTTVCNLGSVDIPWQAAMDADHPVIGLLLARELGGRFEQISARSHVKHAYFAASESSCGSCSPTDGTKLGIGCSDTYDPSANGNPFMLGPPDEVDPWLGVWNPVCSLFDRGDPPVAPPLDCDGLRSFDAVQAFGLGPVGNRMRVKDGDLAAPGAVFWQQAFFLVAGEGEALREDNLGSNAFVAAWNGTGWSLSGSGLVVHGSVLRRWSGARVDSATNGGDDGRVYVAVKVSRTLAGLYHYEYAVHNRDNRRGVGAFRVPKCPSASVGNLGFGDLDDLPGNDWTASVGTSEVSFATTTNPTSSSALRWNSIFNFWFDSDAAPLDVSTRLDAFDPGPGLASLAVTSRGPLRLVTLFLGAGCAAGEPPRLVASGAPPEPRLGNASFGLVSTGNAPGQPSVLCYSLEPGSFSLGPRGCTVYLGPTRASVRVASTAVSDADGRAEHPLPIPGDLALEGLRLQLQCFTRAPGQGRFLRDWNASDGIALRAGNALSDCP
jgi:hypothetical protein